MKPARLTSVARYLPWVLIQGFVLMPSAVGGLTDLGYGPVLNTLSIAIFVLVAFCLVRNLVRLWKAPSVEATLPSVFAFGLSGLFFALVSEGPLVEGTGMDSKLLGASGIAISASLIMLTVRQLIRLRPVEPSGPKPDNGPGAVVGGPPARRN
jgi:hypothetical protein